jgi:hypothetical protein
MQIRYPVEITLEEYIEQRSWEQAQLPCCPFHPAGECGLAKHGTYPRKVPQYCQVARWCCPEQKETISLLPDFFASRLPGTLNEVEQAVNIAESSASMEDAAEKSRPDILLPGGLRWLRRRIRYVREALTILAGLLANGCTPDLESFRKKYNTDQVLSTMRGVAEEHLQSLPRIIGFCPRPDGRYSLFYGSNNGWGLSMAV